MADVSPALLPSVAPETRAPESYQRISANPEAFGASIAKGVEKLGAGLDKASDNAFAVSAFYGKVSVDDQINQVMTGSDRIRRGDPAKSIPGPDGAPQPDVGYLGTSGRTALEARQPTEKALDDLISGARGNLKSEQERLDFDTQTRRMRSLWTNEISAHSDREFKTWAGGVNAAGAAHSLNGYVNNLDNPESMANHARDYISFKVKNAQLKFGDDPSVVGETVAQAKRELLKAQVDAVEVRDPLSAQRLLDKNKAIAGADYVPLAEKLRGRVDQSEGIATADRLVKAATSQPYSSLNHPSYAAAATANPGGMSAAGLARTAQIESSGNPNAGAGTAHVGLGAFSVDAAAEVGITNRTDPEQSISGIAKYAAKNAPVLQKSLGRAPDDAELYLAHQQGAGGASKLLANPDARAGDLVGDAAIRQNRGNPDAPAAAFTAMWKDRFDKAGSAVGTGGNGAQLAHREGAIKLSILNDPEMTARPQMQSAALSRVGQWFAAQRETLSQDDAAFKLRVANTTAEAMDTGAVQTPIPREDFIATYGMADGDKHFNDYQANVQLGADLRATASMSPAELAQKRADYQPVAGAEDYILQGKRYDALDKAIRQNEALKQKDPAAFLIARTDVGASAFKQFQATVADPKATPQARNIAASLYAERMLAEQARLGITPDARRIVPEAYTESLTARLNAPPDAKGQMAPIADILEGESKLWGSNWPAVTRQLGKDAGPTVRVLSSGIKQSAAQSLQQLNGLSLSQILKDQDTEKNATIKKDVLDAFKPFASSLAGNAGGLSLFNDFRGEAEKLAGKYVIGGMTSKDASTKAFEDILGFKYTFQDGYRVPKEVNIPPDAIAQGSVLALRDLGKIGVKAASDNVGGLSPEYLLEGKIRSLQRDGKWVTAPDETGLLLTHDGQGVRRADGSALILTWKQLSDMGTTHTRETAAAVAAGVSP